MRKKRTKTYKHYWGSPIKTKPIINTIKNKTNISTIKLPKHVRCDPTGVTLTVIVVGCLVVAAGGAYTIIRNYLNASASFMREIYPEAMPIILAQVCPKPEIIEALLALDPNILKLLCSTIEEARVAHAWLGHVKIPFMEAVPKINSADLKAVAHYYHELLGWKQAQNYNENAWWIANCSETGSRWGLIENQEWTNTRNYKKILFLKSTDFAPCPSNYMEAFAQQTLELHPSLIKNGYAQHWATLNELRFRKYGAMVIHFNDQAQAYWYYYNGSVRSMYLNYLVDVTKTDDQLALLADFRDGIIRPDPLVFNDTAYEQAEQLWKSKYEWTKKYYLNTALDYSLNSCTSVKTPNTPLK